MRKELHLVLLEFHLAIGVHFLLKNSLSKLALTWRLVTKLLSCLESFFYYRKSLKYSSKVLHLGWDHLIGIITHSYFFQLIQKLQIKTWSITHSPSFFAISLIVFVYTIFPFNFVFYIIIYPGEISVITRNKFTRKKMKACSMISFSKFTCWWTVWLETDANQHFAMQIIWHPC